MRRINGTVFHGLLLATCVVAGHFYTADRTSAETPNPPQSPVFSSAKRQGEVAIFDVEEPKCWSHVRYRLEYTAHPTPQVTVFVPPVEDKVTRKQLAEGALRRLGTVTLTPAQVERLDERIRQIRSYRSTDDKDDDIATFTLVRNGRRVYSEEFASFPTGISMLEDSDVRDVEAIPDDPHKTLWFRGTRPVLSLSRLQEIAKESGAQEKSLPYRDVKREETMAWRVLHWDEICAEFLREERKQTDHMVANLPGRATIEKDFFIKKVHQAGYQDHGKTLTAKLKARNGHLINDVTWYNPLKDGKPTLDWNDLSKSVNAVEARLRRMPWLADWKAADGEHSIEIVVVGTKPSDKWNQEESVLPAWNHAGLRGKPVHEVTLTYGSGGSMTVFGSDEDDRLLVIDVYPTSKPNPTYWFAGLRLEYKPEQKVPRYAVINPDGTGSANTRSDIARATRYARENDTELEE